MWQKPKWQRLKNLFASLNTYADLSPDLRVRRRVRQLLRDRPALSAEEWFEQCWKPLEVSKQVTDFVYVHLPIYSGLEISRVQPNDRLVQDLQFFLICWFDWEIALCEDFFQCFGVDLLDRFEPQDFQTIEDLVLFLNHQLQPAGRP